MPEDQIAPGSAGHSHRPTIDTPQATGLPVQPEPAGRPAVTWYEHARAYSQMKWPDLAAKSRRPTAEALTTITLALTGPCPNAPGPELLRRALFGYAFNAVSASQPIPPQVTRPLDWIAKASLPLAALDDPDTVRAALSACARRLDGGPAAATITRRKRAVLASALGYAVERRLLPASPLSRIQWKATEVAKTVNRRSVASPAQGARLLAAVRGQGPRGEHMEAFFGCLYYAALRPSEAIALRAADLVLPDSGWGRIDLAASSPRAGTAWTDDGASRQERGLKHRPPGETRSIPIPPALVGLLSDHLKSTAPGRAAGCSAPRAAGRSTTPATAKSGIARAPSR